MYKDRIRIYRSVIESGLETEKNGYCVYWMQQAQRIHYNHALSYGIALANKFKLKLVVYFGLTTSYPEANMRHYTFMMEGLAEVMTELEGLGIGWVMADASPDEGIIPLLSQAQMLIMDKGYLPIQRQWRKKVAEQALVSQVSGIYEVETDLIVPIEKAHEKEAYAARTIRPRIMKQLHDYATPVQMDEVTMKWARTDEEIVKTMYPMFKGTQGFNWLEYLENSPVNKEVPRSDLYHGGYSEALANLDHFFIHGLSHYDESNTPAKDYTSKMSLYLHFGQIASLEIYHRLLDYANANAVPQSSMDGFIEQLIVRRELAFNYCYYRSGFDRFETMTYGWAYETMEEHKYDDRPIIYSLDNLERYETHDIYWNASMKEMVETGYMHNYMRMYWCKKIIEWTSNHKTAYEWAIYLNNKYFIDGRDANSYTGVAWCFGLHDHGWKERPIFGKLRYMNDKGLNRKFDMQAYIDRVNLMVDGDSFASNEGQQELDL